MAKLGIIKRCGLTLASAVLAQTAWSIPFYPLGETQAISRFSDKPLEYKTIGDLPERPELILEIGNKFLDTGNLGKGFVLPGGAIWQPRVWVFAISRNSISQFDARGRGGEKNTDLVLDFQLFANIQLTGTEKIVLGWRPLDKSNLGQFSGYDFEKGENRTFTNFDFRTAFFEGDFGGLFPALNKKGRDPIDFGFTIGRQPLNFQEGILINDVVDAVGIVRNNIKPFAGISNLRVSLLAGWNELDRNLSQQGPTTDGNSNFYGAFLSWDSYISTWNADFLYVDDRSTDNKEDELLGDGGDSFHIGISAAQRINAVSTTFRLNHSDKVGRGDGFRVGTGTLASAEFAWTPERSDDIVYANFFFAKDNFTQAGREPLIGGPLANFGILLASAVSGRFGAEVTNFGNDNAGFALGYQAFWDEHKRNIIFEVAGKKDLNAENEGSLKGKGFDQLAVGFQLQQQFAQRFLFQVEGFYTWQEGRRDALGWRTEMFINF